MLPFIEILGRRFPSYGILMLIGGAAAALVLLYLAPIFKIKRADSFYMFLMAFVGGLVGAKVLGCLTDLPMILSARPLDLETVIMNLANGSMVFWGGFIGGCLFVYYFVRKFQMELYPVMNLFAAAVPIAHGFGRLGCLCAGCCYGIPSSFGIVFQNPISAPAGIPLFPTQALESGFNFILGFVLIFLARRTSKGDILAPLYLIIYPIFRFTIEFFRGDLVRGIWFGLSTSQWISILMFIFGVILMLTHRRLEGYIPAQKKMQMKEQKRQAKVLERQRRKAAAKCDSPIQPGPGAPTFQQGTITGAAGAPPIQPGPFIGPTQSPVPPNIDPPSRPVK